MLFLFFGLWSYSLLGRGCCEASTVFAAPKCGPSNNRGVAVLQWSSRDGLCKPCSPQSVCQRCGMRQEEPVPHLPVLGMKEHNDANTSLVQNEGCAEGGQTLQPLHQQMWWKQLCQHRIQSYNEQGRVNSALCRRAQGMQRWLLWFCV